MATAARTVMTTAIPHMTTDVLTLSQLLSPSFPLGAFAYSHGLETAINGGAINDVIPLLLQNPKVLVGYDAEVV